MKGYGVNIKRVYTLTKRKTDGIYKSTGLYKAFNRGGISHIIKSSKLPQIKASLVLDFICCGKATDETKYGVLCQIFFYLNQRYQDSVSLTLRQDHTWTLNCLLFYRNTSYIFCRKSSKDHF